MGLYSSKSAMVQDRAKRVMIVVEALDGGGGRHVADLASGLVDDGYSVFVLYGTGRLSKKYLMQLRARLNSSLYLFPITHLVRDLDFKQDILALFDIIRIIRDVKPDIVHCHSSKAGVLGRLAAKFCRIQKVFYTPHAYSFQAPEFDGTKRKLFIMLERWFSRNATTQTFNVSSGERCCALHENIDVPKKFRIIRNGIPNIRIQPAAVSKKKMGFNPEDRIVGTVARLSQQKNPLLFCHIAEVVIKREANLHFVYIGSGPECCEVKDYLASHGLNDRVHLLGEKDDAEQLISGFDVFLMTSVYEGMPYSLIEAMRAGVPIVATDVTGPSEVVTSEDIGTLFRPNDLCAAGDAVCSWIKDKEPVEASYDEYLKYYTLENMVLSVESAYQQIDF